MEFCYPICPETAKSLSLTFDKVTYPFYLILWSMNYLNKNDANQQRNNLILKITFPVSHYASKGFAFSNATKHQMKQGFG